MITTPALKTKVKVRYTVCDVIDRAVSARRAMLLVYSPRPWFFGKTEAWVDEAETTPPDPVDLERDDAIRRDLPYKAPRPLNTPRPERPAWMVEGALVKVLEWVGEIIEVAVSDSRLMVLVTSPKGIVRHHAPEWLEYVPDMIAPATPEQAAADVARHRKEIEKMLAEIDELKEHWRL